MLKCQGELHENTREEKTIGLHVQMSLQVYEDLGRRGFSEANKPSNFFQIFNGKINVEFN